MSPLPDTPSRPSMRLMLAYDMPLWRPPSERRNLIIQAMIGCSFNRCTFCSMYRSKSFHARPIDDVSADIKEAARYYPDAHRVFLADGDALVLPTAQLHRILDALAAHFPNLARVSRATRCRQICYANRLKNSLPSRPRNCPSSITVSNRVRQTFCGEFPRVPARA